MAHDRGTSLSKTLADLVRGGLCPEGPGERVSVDQNTGLPVVHLGTTVTTDTVRALLDEE